MFDLLIPSLLFASMCSFKIGLLNVDYAKMKVTDLDHQPESIEAQNDAIQTSITDTKPIMDINWE